MHFEEIYLYNEVRIEADGVTLIHFLLTMTFVVCFMRPFDRYPHIHTFNLLFASRRFPVDHKII